MKDTNQGLASTELSRRQAPQTPLAGDALELVRAAVDELPCHTGDRLTGRSGDEDLVGFGEGATRAPTWTATPVRSSASMLDLADMDPGAHSRPIRSTASRTAHAHSMALDARSNTMRKSSPRVFTSRPS